MRYLKGKKVLITAGPTREYIDPVRYISNDSSGKMGYALAEAALKMGAKVTLISGPTNLTNRGGLQTVHVVSAREMYRAALKAAKSADIIICAAAVSDFRPKIVSRKKIKVGETRDTRYEIQLSLATNPDILKEIGQRKRPSQLLIGFALETDNLIKNAKKKMKDKNCDMIVANLNTAIGKDKTRVKIIRDDKIISLSASKKDIAAKILDLLNR